MLSSTSSACRRRSAPTTCCERDVEQLRDARCDLGGIGQILERDPADTIGKARLQRRQRRLDQSALADPARTRDHQQPAIGTCQQRAQLLQFLVAAEERVHVCRGRRGRRAGRAAIDGGGQRTEVGRWVGAQRLGERCGVLGVGALRLPPAPEFEQRAQPGGDEVFVERLVGQQPLGQRQRWPGRERIEVPQRGAAAPVGQPGALKVQPLRVGRIAGVVQAVKQRSARERKRFVDPALGQCALEPLDVAGDLPAHAFVLHLDALRPRQRLGVVQHLAQIAARRRLVVRGPEQRRQFVASHPVAAQREVGEQLAAPLQAQRCGHAVMADLGPPEQTHCDVHPAPAADDWRRILRDSMLGWAADRNRNLPLARAARAPASCLRATQASGRRSRSGMSCRIRRPARYRPEGVPSTAAPAAMDDSVTAPGGAR
jgi:hypothetical protein